jgi:hypothetical protein
MDTAITGRKGPLFDFMVELEYGHQNSLETCSGEDAKRLQECGDLLWERVANLSDKKLISHFISLMHFVEERKLRGEYARKNAQCIQRYGRVLMGRVFATRSEREALYDILRCVRKHPDGRVDEDRDTDYVRRLWPEVEKNFELRILELRDAESPRVTDGEQTSGAKTSKKRGRKATRSSKEDGKLNKQWNSYKKDPSLGKSRRTYADFAALKGYTVKQVRDAINSHRQRERGLS